MLGIMRSWQRNNQAFSREMSLFRLHKQANLPLFMRMRHVAKATAA
jgi:hypothetical protein